MQNLLWNMLLKGFRVMLRLQDGMRHIHRAGQLSGICHFV